MEIFQIVYKSQYEQAVKIRPFRYGNILNVLINYSANLSVKIRPFRYGN